MRPYQANGVVTSHHPAPNTKRHSEEPRNPFF